MANETEPRDEALPAVEPGELGRLGHYRVLGLIGKGGMGQVYRAEDMRLQRQVALKVMNKRFAALPHSRKRFLDEARAVAAIHHDHVVTIFEVGETAGVPFMAMELLVGETLEARLEEGRPQPVEWSLELAEQLARGLAAAHRRGIIHRDVKPGNIWIEAPSGRVKLLDFGLALASTPVDSVAGRGSVMGTPGYLSPEQACGDPLDDRSDLFSVGVVLYRLVCGQLPFPAATVSEQLIKILAHPPRHPQEVQPKVPPPVGELILRLLAKEPRERFRSAEALQTALVETLAVVRNQRQAAIVIAAEPPSKSSGRGRGGKSGAATPASRPWWRDRRVGAAAAVAAIIAVTTAWMLRPGEPPRAMVAEPAGDAPASPVVLARSLDVLSLVDIPAASGEVLAGDQARFQLTLANAARSPEEDPRVINRGVRVIAQITVSLRRSDQPEAPPLTPGFPQKLSAAMLPAPGQSRVIDIAFLSAAIPPGPYDVLFELQSPHGTPVAKAQSAVVIEENLATADLLAFDTFRTEGPGGADTFVLEGSDQDFGARPYLEVDRAAGTPARPLKHAYLRFDLSDWSGRRAEIDRALLLLSLDAGGLQGKATLVAYGVTAELPADWAEKGAGHLTWATSPSSGDVESYPFLGRVELDNRGGTLEHRRDEVRLFGRGLDDYLRTAPGESVTILLVRTSGGDKPTRLISREGLGESSPALALRAAR